MRSTTLTFLVLLAAGAAACGAGDESGDRGSPGSTAPLDPPAQAEVLLVVEDVGGFVPVEWNLTRVPRFVVMTDGTVHSVGPTTLEYPGKALPNIRTTDVGAEGVQELLGIVEEMGLPEITEERNQDAMQSIADAAETVVTFFDADGSHTFSVYALGMPDVSVEDERAAALEELIAVLDRLVAEGEDVGAYQPERVEAFARPAQPPAGPDDPGAEFANVAEWPLPTAFAEMAESEVEFRCVLLEGAEATTFLDRMADANQATTFEHDGAEYTVLAHPLFPHEQPSC